MSPSFLELPEHAPPVAPALVLPVLEQVEELPDGATGALVLGTGPTPRGTVLVEDKRLCWAMASGMSRRLGEILRLQAGPPLEAETLDSVCRECRDSGIPFGETLVSRGLISPADLRRALRQQTVEALAHIIADGPVQAEWVPHRKKGYNATFTFTTGETYVAACVLLEHLATSSLDAQTQLRVAAGKEAWGAAFVEVGFGELLPIAQVSTRSLGSLHELGLWSQRAFASSVTFASGVRIVTTGIRRGGAFLAWFDKNVTYTLVCASQHAQARVLTRLGSMIGS